MSTCRMNSALRGARCSSTRVDSCARRAEKVTASSQKASSADVLVLCASSRLIHSPEVAQQAEVVMTSLLPEDQPGVGGDANQRFA